jgi:oxygen-independent coproporphyrinogen-3 oxidase
VTTAFPRDLVARYDVAGPRYTSYPTALQFTPAFGSAQYVAAVRDASAAAPERPLSLYFHLPFCSKLCWYCACNRIISNDRGVAPPYVGTLIRELALHAACHGDRRHVEQLHWGGGTPTFIGEHEATRLMAATRRLFDIAADAELGIEVDPRDLRDETLGHLAGLGFNRVSLGVQDFDPLVQRAVHRLQPPELVERTTAEARRQGFRSVSYDLLYGLPLQNASTMRATLERVCALRPDRVALYNYAHLPDRFPAQRRIRDSDLPGATAKLDLLAQSVATLTGAGYVHIGMDHFALPDDDLARAQRAGRLQRNFQGYSTHAGADLIGVGASAIGMPGDAFYQNDKELDAYVARVDAGDFAVARGLAIEPEDRIRRAAIMALICHYRLDHAALDTTFGIDSRAHFALELARLDAMAADGLLVRDDSGITVTESGRFLIRNICMVFDRHLAKPAQQPRFSRVL